MLHALLFSVRFHDGRYHGADDWPPAPARLFQALVSAAAKGRTLSDDDKDALLWLETLSGQSPPSIAAPAARNGRGFTNFVPNNDLDAVDGDPHRVGEIRVGKVIRPRLFDGKIPLLYVWTFNEGAHHKRHAQTVCRITERLYQFGRGVDMAWASAEILGSNEADAKLAAHPGPTYKPAHGGDGVTLPCPQPGSLASLIERFDKTRHRFKTIYAPAPTEKDPGRAKPAGQLFMQPPKPRFRPVPYDIPTKRHLFDLRRSNTQADFAAWPLTNVVRLVERVRDAASLRLNSALPGKEPLIERVLVGRNANESDKTARVRIVPLPSVGHAHADRAIRRIMIEVPPNCPLRADDVIWAFSGLDLGVDYQTGEVLHENQPILTSAEDEKMLAHYGLDVCERNEFRRWRTVTPAALPERVARRRIDPFHVSVRKEQKDGSERMREESRAATAVLQALRHVEISGKTKTIRVQREPFEHNGQRAESFAQGTRFVKERLWHVEIAFGEAVRGPIIIGDGRYLGLGLMAPVENRFQDAFTFQVRSDVRLSFGTRSAIVEAVRRALMSRERDANGGKVSVLFSGHGNGAEPARSGRHEHVYLCADGSRDRDTVDRLHVIAPWRVDRSWAPSNRDENRKLFESVVAGLQTVRAGAAGILSLEPVIGAEYDDAIFRSAKKWTSHTPYRPTRHAKRNQDIAAFASSDLLSECLRRGLPHPEITVTEIVDGPRDGANIRACLQFKTAVAGPILLGRDAHAGVGLFVPEA